MTGLIEVLTERRAVDRPLRELIDELPQLRHDTDLGDDIARAHETLLSDQADEADKRSALRRWIARDQPCLFGRLAMQGEGGPKGLSADMCWLDDDDIDRGRDHVSARIQQARREWKDRAEQGLSSGFLIMFNSRRLAFAQPGPELVEVCVELSNLYLVEHAPIVPDVIYTEAVPFRRSDEVLTLFKAGCNIFYAGAHGTVNHDRRLPGGLMFSMNSPGHYANAMSQRGVQPDFEAATEFVRETAFRSIGNGGIGCPYTPSASWHNETQEGADASERKRPAYIPDNFDPTRYSAVYHTDVLVPTAVTSDARRVAGSYSELGAEIWPYLILNYITTDPFPADHVNHGLFHGHPVEECAKYHNPWPPRVAHNRELFEY